MASYEYCPECHEFIGSGDWDHCPNCGADFDDTMADADELW